MKSISQKICIVALLISIVGVAMADMGIGKKNKNKTILNIVTPSTIKNSIGFNLKSGLSYKGSLLSSTAIVGTSIMSTYLISYQKGNITYIIPYKHKIAVSDVRLGYSGIKLIIRPH